ncbi:MAG: glycosyltransferase [Acidimicrobiia bacterium]
MILATKRLLRPLIPDRVMARYRLHQHSRHARVNVDVFLEDPRLAKRWLAVTPDTYRVRLTLPAGATPDDVELVEDPERPVGTELRARVRALLADPEIGAAVVGETPGPRLIDRRRAEPVVGPRLIAMRSSDLAELGGVPVGSSPLPGLLARIRDAGHRIGLLPLPPGTAPTRRSDEIATEPVVILAAVPMHDIGGGARSTQLALELLRQGYHVTLVSLYDAQETVDLGLRYIHPNLEQYRVGDFDPAAHHDRAARSGLVLVEAPAAPLIGHGFALQDLGWELVYDLIDDWSDPSLGGDWFRPDLENQLVESAGRLIASAPDLVERLRRMGRHAILVPNAVNAEIFGVELPPRPHDLPEAETIIGYHGSLYGDWFDWVALREVALAFPDAAVVIIGDDKAPRPEMPPNVHFLGLKPQSELPAYLQRFDVGIIPFKVNETTHAISPLKVYEYLASGVPVAAPPLRSLEGLDGVVCGELIVALDTARRMKLVNGERLLLADSWEARVRELMPNIFSPNARSTTSTTVKRRYVAHHPPRTRLC